VNEYPPPSPRTPALPPIQPLLKGRSAADIFEDGLSAECSIMLRIPNARKLLRMNSSYRVRNWIVDHLVQGRMLQNVHIQALRLISEVLDHPLKEKDATAIDLAKIAVAEITRLREQLKASLERETRGELTAAKDGAR
jgi:hypothetical protein